MKTPLDTEETGMQFPCEFIIKIFGLAGSEFEISALGIIRQHFTDLREDAIRSRLSQDGKYLALSITVRADSRAQLDAVYQELTANPLILMTL
jgi:uncharacterized protein